MVTIARFKQSHQALVFTRDGPTAYMLTEEFSISKLDREALRVGATLSAPVLAAKL